MMEQTPSASSALPKTRRGRGRSIGAGFLYFGIYFVIQTTVSIVYVFSLLIIGLLQNGFSFDPTTVITQTIKNAAILSGLCNLITLVVYWIFFSARHCRFGLETHLTRPNIPSLLLMIPLGLSCYTLVVCILSQLPESLLQSYAASSESLLSDSSPLAIFCLVALAPFAEEVTFRGLLFTRLKSGFGRLPAMFLASVLFGLMHGQFIWILYAFALSLLLCTILDWYHSLWACILLHMSFNTGQYVAAPFLEQIAFLPMLCGSILFLFSLLLLAYRTSRKMRED